MIASPRFLFLVDSLGALISAAVLFFVVRWYEDFFGMPAGVVDWLAGVAALFSVYSVACYIWAGRRWRPLLTGIALANLLYCLLTLTLAGVYFTSLTSWGLLYFLGEVAIIGTLIYWELKTVKERQLPAAPGD